MSTKQAIRDFRAWLQTIRHTQDEIYQATPRFFALLEQIAKEADAVRKSALLAQAKALPFPKNFWIRFMKDWHQLGNVDNVTDFVRITAGKGWGSKRRGEAFERWIQIQLTRGGRLDKVSFKADDALLQELELNLRGRRWRDPDRFRVRSKALWDHKHFHPGTQVDAKQLNVYIDLAKLDTATGTTTIDRVCYLFSTEQAARNNLNLITATLQANPFPPNSRKSLQVLYLDSIGALRRLAKLE